MLNLVEPFRFYVGQSQFTCTPNCVLSLPHQPHVNNREHFFFTLPCNHQQPSGFVFSRLFLTPPKPPTNITTFVSLNPCLSPLPHTINNINSHPRYKIKLKVVAQIYPNSDLNRNYQNFFRSFYARLYYFQVLTNSTLTYRAQPVKELYCQNVFIE